MKLKLIAAGIAATVVASAAWAQQGPKPEDVIKYRKSVMAVIGWNFGPMGAMVKGEKPFDKAAFARNAARIEQMSSMPMEGFLPGTDKGETKAKPEIWQNPDKFKAAMEKMQSEVGKLASAAKGGDEAAMKAQFGETAKTCKGCHDDFRSK